MMIRNRIIRFQFYKIPAALLVATKGCIRKYSAGKGVAISMWAPALQMVDAKK